MVLLINTLTWTCGETSSFRMWKHRSIKNDVWFQQNGALAHYALAVRENLREVLRDCYLAVSYLCCPILLTGHINAPISHCVIIRGWWLLKLNVAQQHYKILEELQQATRLVSKRVTQEIVPKMSRRMWRRSTTCHQNDGAQTNLLENWCSYRTLYSL